MEARKVIAGNTYSNGQARRSTRRSTQRQVRGRGMCRGCESVACKSNPKSIEWKRAKLWQETRTQTDRLGVALGVALGAALGGRFGVVECVEDARAWPANQIPSQSDGSAQSWGRKRVLKRTGSAQHSAAGQGA
jgi:hypothetical protein